MFKTRDKQELIESDDDGRHDGHGPADVARSQHREEDASERIRGEFDPDPVVQVRWVPWLLAFLVIVCVLLAVWVWFEILHV